jgi:hypothetical protein
MVRFGAKKVGESLPFFMPQIWGGEQRNFFLVDSEVSGKPSPSVIESLPFFMPQIMGWRAEDFFWWIF